MIEKCGDEIRRDVVAIATPQSLILEVDTIIRSHMKPLIDELAKKDAEIERLQKENELEREWKAQCSKLGFCGYCGQRLEDKS